MDKDTIRYITDWILQRNEELKRMGMSQEYYECNNRKRGSNSRYRGGAIDLRSSCGWVV